MNDNGIERTKLPSGINVDMSTDVYYNDYLEFTESQYFSFNNFINAGHYFPQIMQFIMVLVAILKGVTDFGNIILVNVLSGVFYTLIWYWLRFYKIPGLSFISCLIGGNIFRFFLHFIAIAAVAFWVVKDWKVLLYCVIGGIITFIITSLLSARLSSVKYHDEIVKYVSAFKYKQ